MKISIKESIIVAECERAEEWEDMRKIYSIREKKQAPAGKRCLILRDVTMTGGRTAKAYVAIGTAATELDIIEIWNEIIDNGDNGIFDSRMGRAEKCLKMAEILVVDLRLCNSIKVDKDDGGKYRLFLGEDKGTKTL